MALTDAGADALAARHRAAAAAVRPARTAIKPACDLTRGEVLGNLSRLFVVEDARVGADARSRVTYRYTDDRGLVRAETMTTHPHEDFRVMLDHAVDTSAMLDATLGLPL